MGDVPRLPYWWTHDGTLHVELPKLPDSISVRLPDQRDREVRSARVWLYTRDDLQWANAENVRLRSELESVGTAAYLYGRSDLQTENAKLRELVRHLYTCMEHYESDGTVSCNRCPLDNDTQNCDYERRMRELGVEVQP